MFPIIMLILIKLFTPNFVNDMITTSDPLIGCNLSEVDLNIEFMEVLK